MSYGLGMSADATRQFKATDPWLAEEILDELEGIVHDPSGLPPSSGDSFVKYRFSRWAGLGYYHITLTLLCNDGARRLTLVDIFVREISP